MGGLDVSGFKSLKNASCGMLVFSEMLDVPGFSFRIVLICVSRLGVCLVIGWVIQAACCTQVVIYRNECGLLLMLGVVIIWGWKIPNITHVVYQQVCRPILIPLEMQVDLFRPSTR